MKDIFFTILVVWIIFRVLGIGKTIYSNHRQGDEERKKEGEISIDAVSNKNQKKDTDEGEYVDYEEIK